MRFAPVARAARVRDSLRRAARRRGRAAVARAWAAGDSAPGRKLWSRLAEQGVLALALAGARRLGATPSISCSRFEELGRAAVPGPYVESVAVLPRCSPDVEPTAALPHRHRRRRSRRCRAAARPVRARRRGRPTRVYLLDGRHAARRAVVGDAVASVDRRGGSPRSRPRRRSADGRRRRRRSSAACWPRRRRSRRGRGGPRPSHRLREAARASSASRSARSRRSSTNSPTRSSALELARPLLFGAALALRHARPRRATSRRRRSRAPMPRTAPRGSRCRCTARSATPPSTTCRCG